MHCNNQAATQLLLIQNFMNIQSVSKSIAIFISEKIDLIDSKISWQISLLKILYEIKHELFYTV